MRWVRIDKVGGIGSYAEGGRVLLGDAEAADLVRLGWAADAPEPRPTPERRWHWADFLLAVMKAARLSVEQKAALGLQAGATGGYIVPEELAGEILVALYERGVMRPGATVLPMSGPYLTVPSIDVVTPPTAGQTAQFGGAEVSWHSPTDGVNVLQEMEPALTGTTLEARELQAFLKVSEALQSDAVALGTLLPGLLAEVVAWAEDYAFLTGPGTSAPLGILNWSGLIKVSRATPGNFALTDVAGMLARFLMPQVPEAVCWVMHPSVLVQMIAMTGGANVLHVVVDPKSGRPRYLLAGYEVCVTEKVPALGTPGDVLLVDRSKYLIGDRSFELAFSPHVLMTAGQVVWRVVRRVAGQPWLRGPVTLADGVTTVSPVVGLGA